MYKTPFQMAHALTKILMGAWLWGATHAAVTITRLRRACRYWRAGLSRWNGRAQASRATSRSTSTTAEACAIIRISVVTGWPRYATTAPTATAAARRGNRRRKPSPVAASWTSYYRSLTLAIAKIAASTRMRGRSSADLDNVGCSDAFTLLPSAQAPHPGQLEGGGPFLEVFSPQDNDGAIAGEEYTVEFAYDNGLGSSTDRFKIDLYRADVGEGDCGKWITSICDKHEIGCKDSKGDYDVEIPAGAPPGAYRIRVGRFEDDSLFACSGRFHIMHNLSDDYDHKDHNGKTADEGDWASSYSFSMSFDDDDSDDALGGGVGGVGGGAPLDDDDWWMATNLGDDDAPPPPKGGGGLWGDEDDDEDDERQEKDGREEHASTGGSGGGGSPNSFSYDFVLTTEDWYNKIKPGTTK